jgi:arginine repressor
MFAVLVAFALLAAPLAPAWAGEGKKHHDLTVTVVSVDENGKMMTFKTDTGEQKSAPVIGKAIDQMKGLKAGETVTLTCTDKDTGEHEGISDIKVPAAKK